MAKDNQVLIKLSDQEKEGFKRAAELTGVGFSAWARQVLRVAAAKELQNAGEKVTFLDSAIPEGDKTPEEASKIFDGIMKASVKKNQNPKK